jgi:acetolactate synthase-1/2/3 large subunit
MGDDLPEAIGAAVAMNREVICVTGDGSVMMNLQELQTIVHYNFPIKIVVFSNDGYGAIRQTNKNFFNGTYIGCDKKSGVSFPNFEKIANGFDIPYKRCNNIGQVSECLEWLMQIQGYAFLEVMQKLDNPIEPKVMSRMREDKTFESPALHDMYPFLDKKDIDELMLE